MTDLYALAHELLSKSQAAFDSNSYVESILIIQQLIMLTVDIVNGIAATATSVMI